MITKPVLIDAGPLVSLFAEDDQYFEVCAEQAKEIREPVYTCWPAITEAAYLLRGVPDGVRALLSECDGRRFDVLELSKADLPGIDAIYETYDDQGFQLADVCLMYLAQREDIDTVFTFDRRHFSVYRTSDGRALELLPSP